MKKVKAIVTFSVLLLSVLYPMSGRGQESAPSQSVTLDWMPSSDSKVTGYYLYHGAVAGTLTNRMAVGLALTATVSNLPANATYFLFVTAHDSAGRESDPSNLISFTPAISTNAEYADLVVTELNFAPSAPVEGDAVSFAAVIANHGTQPVPAGSNVRVSFQVDGGGVIAWVTLTNALAPGATITVAPAPTAPGYGTWSGAAGAHTVLVTVDDLHALTEAVESNNQFQVNLQVSSAPPQTPVVTLTANHSTVSESDTNGVWFTVQRSGTTTSALTVGLKIEGAARNGIDYALLANSLVIPAGQTAATFRLLPVSDGVVDSGKDVSFTITTSSSYEAGTPKTATVLITNSDSVPENRPDASSMVRLAWSAAPDDTVVGYNVYYGPVATTITNQWNVGQTLTTTITNLVPATTYYFFATSYNSSGMESDPSNFITYTTPDAPTNPPPPNPPTNPPPTNPPTNPPPANLPDLAITQLSYLPLAPAAGDLVGFRAVVTNHSTAPVPSGVNVRVSFAIDGVPFAWRSVATGPLTNGTIIAFLSDKGTGGAKWSAVAGAHTLTATVDDLSAVAELNETNNVFEAPLPVTGVARVLPTVALTVDRTSVGEYDVSGVVLTVTRSGDAAEELRAALSFEGAAVQSGSFLALPGNILIPAGTNAATLQLQPVSNGAVDGNKSVKVSLVMQTNYQVELPGSHTIVIVDQDGDTDGDGMTDRAESIAGTDANDAGSSLKLGSMTSSENGALTFSWPSVPGVTYRLVQRAAMTDAGWQPASEPVTATDSVTSWTITTTNSVGFFALEVIP